MGHHEHRQSAPQHVSIVIITVSDTRTQDSDESGRLTRSLCEAAGHTIADQVIVKDDAAAITAALQRMVRRPEIGAVLINGGTGIAPRDVTCEAVTAALDRRLDGFGELFRSLSFKQIGAAAMLSRAVGGLIGPTAVFAMPGSPAAVRLALESLVLPEIGHIIAEARKNG